MNEIWSWFYLTSMTNVVENDRMGFFKINFCNSAKKFKYYLFLFSTILFLNSRNFTRWKKTFSFRLDTTSLNSSPRSSISWIMWIFCLFFQYFYTLPQLLMYIQGALNERARIDWENQVQLESSRGWYEFFQYSSTIQVSSWLECIFSIDEISINAWMKYHS